jgi:hypothetical protein
MPRLASPCLLALLALSVVPNRLATAQTDCVPSHLRLDPAIANTSRSPFAGKALGQTFFASDTIVSRITVWRPPNNRSVIGAHLYVTGVNSNLRPDVSQMLLDGPTINVFDSDPPGQIIEMSFPLDPPLLLPGRGTYAFFVQAAGCHQAAAWQILANQSDPYADGLYWITGSVSSPCHLRPVDGGSNDTDLLFDIEFCGQHATRLIRGTWGTVKVIYR